MEAAATEAREVAALVARFDADTAAGGLAAEMRRAMVSAACRTAAAAALDVVRLLAGAAAARPGGEAAARARLPAWAVELAFPTAVAGVAGASPGLAGARHFVAHGDVASAAAAGVA